MKNNTHNKVYIKTKKIEKIIEKNGWKGQNNRKKAKKT